jgi:hypothetical protein
MKIIIYFSTLLLLHSCQDSNVPPISISSHKHGDKIAQGSDITLQGNIPPEHGTAENAIATWYVNENIVCTDPPNQDGTSSCEITVTGKTETTFEVSVNGKVTSSTQISLLAEIENAAPECKITAPQNKLASPTGKAITFSGAITDSNDELASLSVRWSSDKDGVLQLHSPKPDGITTFQSDKLSLGSHTITMTASDIYGAKCQSSIQISLHELYKATLNLNIYPYIDLKGDFIGFVKKDNVFKVYENIGPSSKCKGGVYKVEDEGYICSDKAVKTDSDGIALPRIIEFVPPTPQDLKTKEYRKKKSWPALRGEEQGPFMPSIHGRISWVERALHKDVDSYVHSKGRRYNLPTFTSYDEDTEEITEEVPRTYFFMDAIKTEKGWVFEREDGTAMPMRNVRLYGIDRFSGRYTSEHPVPEKTVPAFAYRGDVTLYSEPTRKSEIIRQAEYREELNIIPERKNGYYAAVNIDGKGTTGYLRTYNVRRWVPKERPKMVDDDELWVDIDIGSQMLSLFKGDQMMFTTLISSGAGEHITPQGVFAIYIKHSHAKMAGDDYYIEGVPWVMYFYAAYAIHSAFWHDDYGIPKSHGCVNMSLKDIRYIFENVTPSLPLGWTTAKATHYDTGTIVRVRKGDNDVKDRRPREVREAMVKLKEKKQASL